MGEKIKVICGAKYGHVGGGTYIPYEVVKESFAKMGIETTDRGNGLLQYEMEIEKDSPFLEVATRNCSLTIETVSIKGIANE